MTWLGRWTDALIARLNTLNMTNARQQVTLALVFGTGVIYLFLAVKFAIFAGKEWTPAYEWLGFMALMSGLDGAQFLAKRSTDASYVAAKANAAPTTTTTTVTGDPPITTTKTEGTT